MKAVQLLFAASCLFVATAASAHGGDGKAPLASTEIGNANIVGDVYAPHGGSEGFAATDPSGHSGGGA